MDEVFWILENTVDFDLQKHRKKSEGKVYSRQVHVLGLAGLLFRLAFASGLGTAGQGKKLVVEFGCCRKDFEKVFMC